MIRIEKKLDILSNELSRLSDKVSPESESESPKPEPVTLQSVERRPGPDGNIFSLNLTNNVPDVYYTVVVDDKKIASGSELGESDGGIFLSFTCDGDCKDENTFEVIFTNTSQSSSITFELNNAGSEIMYQEHFTVPSLQIEHAGDLVYDVGSDVRVKVSSSYGEDDGISDLSSSLFVVIPDGDHYRTTTSTHMIEQLEQEVYFKTKETVYGISTSRHPYSGLLNLALTFTDHHRSLVKKLTVERSIVVRPRNQTGPYPDDFLEFAGLDSHLNIVEESCQSNCSLSCSVIGTVTDIQVNRLDPESEQWEPVNNLTETIFDYSRSVEWIARPPADSDNMEFECVAVGVSSNISLEVDVTVYSEEFFIDRNRSSFDVQINPETPMGWFAEGHATVNCTIVGQPVNEASVMVVYDHYHPRILSAQVIPIGPGESVATASVDLHPHTFPVEGLSAFRCSAGSAHNRFDFYTMDVSLPWPEGY